MMAANTLLDERFCGLDRLSWLAAGVFLFLSMGSASVWPAEVESSIARGGRLYDRWWSEKGMARPKGINPLFPKKSLANEANSWRCVECHGWDYLGNAGDFASGEHFTGIKGIAGAQGRDPAAIAAILRDKNHGYGQDQLDDKDAADLALFVSRGQVNLTPYLDRFGKLKGFYLRGEVYFNTICGGCHKGGEQSGDRSLGDAGENRAEVLHKIFNGQPGEDMPALRALDHNVAIDIAAYLKFLPKGRGRSRP